MNEKLKAAVAILSNDEASSDSKLFIHFITEIGLPVETAKDLINRRNEFLKSGR